MGNSCKVGQSKQTFPVVPVLIFGCSAGCKMRLLCLEERCWSAVIWITSVEGLTAEEKNRSINGANTSASSNTQKQACWPEVRGNPNCWFPLKIISHFSITFIPVYKPNRCGWRLFLWNEYLKFWFGVSAIPLKRNLCKPFQQEMMRVFPQENRKYRYSNWKYQG